MNHDKSSLNEIQYPILKMMDEAAQAQRPDKFHEQAKFWFNTNPAIIRELLSWIYQNKAQLHLPAIDEQNPALTILDPFMGFGTVLKEALALDSVPIGIEINPVSWFFAHTEMEQHDFKTITTAFKRLAKRKTWHGTPLQEELLSYYKTACPCEKDHPEKAEVVRLFWIQTDMCSNSACQKRIPLFEDFIIYQKKMTVNYYPDVSCSSCKQKFDWDSDLVTLIVETRLMVNGLQDAAGIDRGAKLWAYSENSVKCPTCQKEIIKSPQLPSPEQKKVLLSVLSAPIAKPSGNIAGICRKMFAVHPVEVPIIHGKETFSAIGTPVRFVVQKTKFNTLPRPRRRKKEFRFFPSRWKAIVPIVIRKKTRHMIVYFIKRGAVFLKKFQQKISHIS
jgi:hypothetical protein